MKVFKITGKNLKLLLRSKTSMFVTIFGPLLIMLLVGFAFNNPSASKINIGYYSSDKTNLTLSFVDALKSNPNFAVVEYPSEAVCTDMIEQGKSHICILFPKNFVLSNNQSNEVIFYVDQSRANFVYAVLDTVSSKVDLTSSQLSYQMTNDLLGAIAFSQQANNDNIGKIIVLKNSLDTLTTNLNTVKSKLSSVDLTETSLDTSSVDSEITTLTSDVNNLNKKGNDVIDAGIELVDNLDGDVTGNGTNVLNDFQSGLGDSRKSINSTYNVTSKHIATLTTLIDDMVSSIDEINTKLANAKAATTDSASKVQDAQTALAQLKTSIDAIKQSSEKINAQFGALRVTSAQSIVNPITTTVKPVSAKTNNLNFIFPYLVILIIMFIAIMLSSTIIIIEKTSKAYFRNFTTPTKDMTFIVSVFLTSLFVVILQLIFVLILAYYFLNTTISSNAIFTILCLLASIILFTFIGMIIGYMFNSQEGVTMASISVGAVLLFLSNLILPLETMSSTLQQISRYNPYVVASELLKKITLFNSKWSEISMDFALIGLYIVVAFVLVLIIQKMSKIQYISKKPIAKQIVRGRKEEIIDKFFKLKNGVLLRNEKELYEELNKMSDVMFAEYVNKEKNDFEGWMLLNNKKELAKIIGKCASRKEMMDALDKYKKQIR